MSRRDLAQSATMWIVRSPNAQHLQLLSIHLSFPPRMPLLPAGQGTRAMFVCWAHSCRIIHGAAGWWALGGTAEASATAAAAGWEAVAVAAT